jgi:hypothetical protein
MNLYIQQLLTDLESATANISFPNTGQQVDFWDWISPEEEDATAPIRNLETWTGITAEMLPPAEQLTDEQVHQLLEALNKLLSACNCEFVLQTIVRERIQYETIRQNFNQNVKVRQWHMGFFELCKPGTEHKRCTLGEHCQCAFFAEFFEGMIDEKLTPEEERARDLELEIRHLKRKHGDRWMKYYPYHLDPDYDDENGNPYNYGFGKDEDDEEDDTWWRK